MKALKKIAIWFWTLWHHRSIIKQLEAEVQKPWELKLVEFKQSMDRAELNLSHPALTMVSKAMISAIKVSFPDAKNYVSLTMVVPGDEGIEYEFTMQIKPGKTPADVVGELKKEVEQLKDTNDMLRYVLRKSLMAQKYLRPEYPEDKGSPIPLLSLMESHWVHAQLAILPYLNSSTQDQPVNTMPNYMVKGKKMFERNR